MTQPSVLAASRFAASARSCSSTAAGGGRAGQMRSLLPAFGNSPFFTCFDCAQRPHEDLIASQAYAQQTAQKLTEPWLSTSATRSQCCVSPSDVLLGSCTAPHILQCGVLAPLAGLHGPHLSRALVARGSEFAASAMLCLTACAAAHLAA